MTKLALAAALCAAPCFVAAQEPRTVETVLQLIDRQAIAATGGVGVLMDDGPIYFNTTEGRRFRVETAVPLADLERMESCDMWGDGCPAEITGILRLQDDYFEVLVETVRFLD